MKNALEIVTFRTKDGIAVADVLKASAEMEQHFITKQKGFIKRTIGKGDGNEWVDVVYWETMNDATKAGEAAMQSPACAPMFGMIDEASTKMSHSEIQN